MVGKNLSHYKILEELGRGGMGIVYKAEDTKLDRTVAIKILPSAALASEDDRARFYREAKAAAQLHHPHIASVFEIDEAVPEGSNNDDLRPFIAMEYIEGKTLDAKIKEGPFKLEDAVRIASEIASALEAAHKKDIVHRDIKSQNVMLTEEGAAKVLDFGLAQTAQSTKLTRMGSTLGTIAYMSPEQARSEEVDLRTDIWSLGVVLYEMIAGMNPFPGDYEQAAVYSILNEDPEPLTAIRTGVPMGVEWIVSKCLAKKAEARYQNAGDLLVDLRNMDLSGSGLSARSMPAATHIEVPTSGETVTVTIPLWVWGIVVVALLFGMAAGALFLGSSADPFPPTRFVIELEHHTQPLAATWSVDGRSIYYVARDTSTNTTHVRLFSLDTGASSVVPGTDNVYRVVATPDGRWIITHDILENRLERLSVSGGEANPIPGTEGTTESFDVDSDGDIYFSTPSFSMAAVSEDGIFREVASSDTLGVSMFAGPIVAPTDDIVYWGSWTRPTNSIGTWANIGGKSAPVLPQYRLRAILGNGAALVTPSGPTDVPVSLVSFDPTTGVTRGAPIPVARMNGLAYSVPVGHLVYEELATVQTPGADEPFYELSKDGSIRLIGSMKGNSSDFTVSNDGRAILSEDRLDGLRKDLFRFDLETQTITRLTVSGENENPFWAPGDEYVYFNRHGDGVPSIARRRVDASAPIEIVVTDSLMIENPAISPDGSTLVYARFGAIDGDLFIRDLTSGEERVLAQGSGLQTAADFSPDGRYVVYQSGTITTSIIVVSFDGTSEIEITEQGGSPVWSQDGAYIYYSRNIASRLYRIPVTTDPAFRLLGNEEQVYVSPVNHFHFDLMPDGQVILSQPEGFEISESKVHVVLNFDDYAAQLIEGQN